MASAGGMRSNSNPMMGGARIQPIDPAATVIPTTALALPAFSRAVVATMVGQVPAIRNEAARIAAKAPGQWQQFVIEFQAPRFQDGKKVANAVFKKVTLNGQVIHDNVEMKGVTGGNLGRGEQPKGPLMFQGNHGAVAYRNICVTLP